MYQGRKGKFVTYFIPDDQPDQLIKVPESFMMPETPTLPLTPSGSSTPTQIPSSSSSSSLSAANAQSLKRFTFQEVVLKKMDDLQNDKKSKTAGENDDAPKKTKRRKVNPFGALVTGNEEFEKIELEARAKEEKEKRKEIKDRKGKNEEAETEDLNGVEEHEEYKENEDEEIDPRAESLTPSFPPKSEPDAFKYLRSVWQDINLPTPEDELIGRFYGAIYYDMRRRPLLYIGRVQRRFLKDAEGPASELTLDCLSLAVSTATVLKEPPIHLRDVGEFTVDNIIAGPVEATLMNLGKWSIPSYPDIAKFFLMASKLDRKRVSKMNLYYFYF